MISFFIISIFISKLLKIIKVLFILSNKQKYLEITKILFGIMNGIYTSLKGKSAMHKNHINRTF